MKAQELINVEPGSTVVGYGVMLNAVINTKYNDVDIEVLTKDYKVNGINLQMNAEVEVISNNTQYSASVDAVQYDESKESVQALLELTGGSDEDVTYSNNVVSLYTKSWKGHLLDGQWLVRKGTKVIKMNTGTFTALFVEGN